MKQSIFEIISNSALTDSVYKMVLGGDTSAITNCGQFVNIQLEGHFLRRPISVCDYDETTLTIIYKVVGKGTEAMSAMVPGETLDILTGLGNGYDLTLSGDKPVLLGGGVGGILGMKTFRHKTKHWYFRYGFPAILILEIAGVLWLVWYFMIR